MATGYYLLYPGANISISQANDGLLDGAGFYNGGRATIIGNGGFGAGANSAAIGGTFNGSPGQAASLLFLYAGSNIGMSQSLGGPDNMFGSLTINAAGGGGAPAILWQDVNRSETYSNINTIYLGDAVYADGMMNSANQVSGSMVLNAYGFSVNAAGHAGTRALWLYAGSNVSFQTHSDQAGALSLTINAAATAAAMAAGEGVSRLERLEHLIARLSTLI
jgi:hypothetical protein